MAVVQLRDERWNDADQKNKKCEMQKPKRDVRAFGGGMDVGQAADTDTLVASANAYISALNKMIIKREKTAPMEQESQKVRGI